jgi:hypothetical protein
LPSAKILILKIFLFGVRRNADWHSYGCHVVRGSSSIEEVGATNRSNNLEDVMEHRGLRSLVTRLVLGAGIAFALLAGTFSIVGPTAASARTMSCAYHAAKGKYYQRLGFVEERLGFQSVADHYFDMAAAHLAADCY